jgi:uncharacterized protein (TIGR02246 family)
MSTPGDEAAIRQTWQGFVRAFNLRDARACAAFFTADGDRVDSASGESFQGRENLERSYADLFNSRYKGGTLVGEITQIRFVSSEVALAESNNEFRAFQGSASEGRSLRATTLYVKQGGTWMIAAHRPMLLMKNSRGHL